LFNETKEEIDYSFVGHTYIDEKFIKMINTDKLFMLKDRKKNPLSYFYSLFKLCKNDRFEYIHIHGNSYTVILEIIASKLANNSSKIIVHTHNTNANKKLFSKFLNFIVFHLSYKRIACGNEAGLAMYGDRHFEVINNAIDIDRFKYNKNTRNYLRNKLKIGDSLLLGNIARFNSQKNQQFLINMMAYNKKVKKISNLKLLLIGDGPNQENLLGLINKYDLSKNIIILDPQDDTSGYYSAIDLFLLPSRYEGLPLVLIEAQSASLNSIVSDKVDPDCNVTKLIKFNSIEDNEMTYNSWLDDIDAARINLVRNDTSIILKENGFDLKDNTKIILELYK